MAQTFEHIWTRKPMIVSLSVKVIICFCLSWKNWLHSGLLKNLEQNKLLLNLENFTSHCLKNPEIWLVLLIGPLLIRTYCVYDCSSYFHEQKRKKVSRTVQRIFKWNSKCFTRVKKMWKSCLLLSNWVKSELTEKSWAVSRPKQYLNFSLEILFSTWHWEFNNFNCRTNK